MALFDKETESLAWKSYISQGQSKKPDGGKLRSRNQGASWEDDRKGFTSHMESDADAVYRPGFHSNGQI